MNINIRITLFTLLCVFFSFFSPQNPVFAQNKGQLSGDLQFTAKFYERDSLRNAIGTPFYDYLFYGGEAWLTLNYAVKGFDMGIPF